MRRIMAAALAGLASTHVLAAPPGWNAAWDSSVRTVSNGQPVFSDAADDPAESQEVTLLRMLVMGQSPEAAQLFDFWAWAGVVESCKQGFATIADTSSEFGDRKRGFASLAGVRQRTVDWAAQHGPVLSVYFPAILGSYSQGSQAFALKSVGRATLNPARIKFGKRGAGTMSGGDLITIGAPENPRTIFGQRNSAVCVKDAKQQEIVWYSSKTQVLLNIGTYGFPGVYSGANLKSVPMSMDNAKTYLAKNVNRGAVYEVQLRISSEPGQYLDDLREFGKEATVQKVIVRDESGSILTEY